jgi:hypothetical protein
VTTVNVLHWFPTCKIKARKAYRYKTKHGRNQLIHIDNTNLKLTLLAIRGRGKVGHQCHVFHIGLTLSAQEGCPQLMELKIRGRGASHM